MFRLSDQTGPDCILGRAGEKVGQWAGAGSGLAPDPTKEMPSTLQCDKVQAGEEEEGEGVSRGSWERG